MAEDAEIQHLREEVERYRQATQDALEQLDWCIGYLHGSRKGAIAAALGRNRSHIRRNLLQRAEEPVPTNA
jgi:hypothetical protein